MRTMKALERYWRYMTHTFSMPEARIDAIWRTSIHLWLAQIIFTKIGTQGFFGSLNTNLQFKFWHLNGGHTTADTKLKIFTWLWWKLVLRALWGLWLWIDTENSVIQYNGKIWWTTTWKLLDSNENPGVFELSGQESSLKICKFKIADPIWQSKM